MKLLRFIIVAVVAVIMSSCYTTRTSLGDFNKLTDNGDTNTIVYSREKQCYVISDLVPLKMKHAPVPSTGNAQVVTKRKFLDGLVSDFTLGIFTMRTIEVLGVESDGLTPLVKQKVKVKKEKFIIDNGLQYEVEVGAVGGSLGLSYKFAKRFSIGMGYWFGMQFTGKREDLSISQDNSYYKQYISETRQDGTVHSTESMARLSNCVVKKFYFNAQIRPWDKWFSPIIGGNLGWQTVATDEFYYPIYGDKQTQLYITPYGGISLRCGKNCYVSLKVGYNMVMGKVKPKDGDETTDNGKLNAYVDVQGKYTTSQLWKEVGSYVRTTKYPKVGVSTPYASLNFTHTLNIGQGLHEKAIEKTRSIIDKVKKK